MNAIVKFEEIQKIGTVLYRSGFFKDTRSEAQAITKVIAGHELGIPPFAAMSGLYVISGKVVLGASILSALIANDPRYSYKVLQATDEVCEIEFYENGELQGVGKFTMEEARKAGLSNKDNWRKYPSDMLFARAISRGARRYTPGIFGGAQVYTPEEIGIDMSGDGEYIDTTAREITGELPLEKPDQDPKEYALGLQEQGLKYTDIVRTMQAIGYDVSPDDVEGFLYPDQGKEGENSTPIEIPALEEIEEVESDDTESEPDWRDLIKDESEEVTNE